MPYVLSPLIKLLMFAFVFFVLIGVLVNNKPDNHKGA